MSENYTQDFISNVKGCLNAGGGDTSEIEALTEKVDEIEEILKGETETFSIKNDTFSTEANSAANVFSSSWYGSYDRKAYKAFDDNTTTQWCCKSTDDMNGEYIGYNFGKLIRPAELSINFKNSNGSNPSFKIQACADTVLSDDNVWIDVSEEVSYTTNGTYTEVFDLSGVGEYSMYRVLFTSGAQSSGLGTDVYEIVITGEYDVENTSIDDLEEVLKNTATDEDIDAIIAGTYVESEE